MIFFVERSQIHKAILRFIIIHPMVMLDWKYKKSKGHMVLTECWRIRMAKGLSDFVPQTSDFCVYVEDE
jgi:hypothetical protein